MISNAFALIRLILMGLSLWEGFLSWLEANHSKEIEERKQRREAAIEAIKNAQTEDEFDKAQSDIVRNGPRP